MQIIPQGALRIGIPDVQGNYLYNETIKSFSDKLFLAINDDGSSWKDVTPEERTMLEAELSTENHITEDVLLKAQAYDIITGGLE